MRIHNTMVVAAMMALSLMGCSDSIAVVDSGDAERAAISERVLALRESVMAAGEMNGTHQRELNDIKHDVAEWQTRTGRVDLAMSEERYVQNSDERDKREIVDLANTLAPKLDKNAQAAAVVARMLAKPVAIIMRPPTPSKCAPCVPVKTSGGYVCFLIDRGVCNPELPTLTCAYQCMKVA